MKNAFKKAFTGAVAVLTIVWSVGLVNLPMTARAASAGDVIKGTTLSTVYYYGSDGSRYAFPNEKTYLSWYEDFSDVTTLSDTALAAIPLAGNIVYRPGSHWIKIQSDPKTYAVTTDGTIRWIETEEVAEGLAGADWNAFIDDVSDTFFVDYTVGTSLMSAADGYEGALVADGSDTYIIWGGEKLLVDDMSDNAFQTRFVLDGADIALDGLTTGTALAAEDTEMTDTAQQGGTTAATGGLSISLASDTPASVTIPSSADSVEVATYKVTATDGAATIEQMIFRLSGVGATTNIANTYLYEGDDRLTNSRSINSTTREVTFSSLDLDFDDGEIKYVTIRVDVAAASVVAAGDTVAFSLVSADDVTTDSDVSGTFPITANTMTFSDTVAGTLTIIDNGSITNPTLGQEGATIAKVKFSAATEGAAINQVMFDVDNAADHDNFELYEGSTLLANGTADGKKVTFVLSPAYDIAKGADKTLLVKADIGGEAADVISVAIEESADVMATGSIYGFNMGIDVTGFDQTGNANCLTECSESTVQGGKLTFAFNGPSATNIAVDADDVDFMDFTLTAANWVQVKGIDVIVASTTDDGGTDDALIQTDSDLNLQDISIRLDDGTVWMGPEELSASGSDITQTLTFDDYQDMQAGESLDFMITADIDSGAPNADIYRVTLDMSGTSAEDDNGDDLTVSTDVVPTADIVGYLMTLTTSSMTMQESSTPTAGTYVKGTEAVSFVGYAFTAGTSSDITLTDTTFTLGGDDDGTYTDGTEDVVVSDKITSCSLYDGTTGTLIDGPEGIDTASAVYTVTFNDFSWTVPAGEVDKVTFKCDLANVTSDAGDDAYKVAVVATSGVAVVTAEDEDGDSVNVYYDVDDNGTADDTITHATIGTTDAPEIDVVDAGSLTVAKASDAPVATIVLGSSTSISVAKYKFTATNEAFVVNQLEFVNSIGTTYDRAVDSVTISYTNSEGSTETKTGSLANAIADFGGLDIYVPTTESRYMTVTVNTNSVSSIGATSGDTFDLDLDMLADTMQAIGAGSGTTVYSDTGTGINSGAATDLDGSTMTLYKTKPTISLASGTPSGAAYAGNNDIIHFTIAADSRGYVTLNRVAFLLSSTDVGASNYNVCDTTGGTTGIDEPDLGLYDLTDLSTALDADADWTMYDSVDGSACTEDTDDVDYILLTLTTPDVVAAGGSVTYALYINVNSVGANAANDDTMRVSLETNTTTDTGITGTQGTINWEDDSSGTDLYASLVKTLPIYSNALTF